MFLSHFWHKQKQRQLSGAKMTIFRRLAINYGNILCSQTLGMTRKTCCRPCSHVFVTQGFSHCSPLSLSRICVRWSPTFLPVCVCAEKSVSPELLQPISFKLDRSRCNLFFLIPETLRHRHPSHSALDHETPANGNMLFKPQTWMIIVPGRRGRLCSARRTLWPSSLFSIFKWWKLITWTHNRSLKCPSLFRFKAAKL